MMKVPQAQNQPQREGPPEPFVLMAAAQMHKMGRLVSPMPDAMDKTRSAPPTSTRPSTAKVDVGNPPPPTGSQD